MNTKTILITGSNSGIGLEAARKLAAKPEWGIIVLGARSKAKAEAARDNIMATTGRSADDFRNLIVDLVDPASVQAAVQDVAQQGLRFDAVVLNAGGMPSANGGELQKVPSGQSKLFAMNVGGHAALVNGLLEGGHFSEHATVVFAASEASRGIPMMMAKAAKLPDGYADVDAALDAIFETQDAALTQTRRQVVSALKQIHAVLDDEQRATAVQWLASGPTWRR